jgi:hypothetical protein
MASSASTVKYDRESCDWMSTVVKHVAAHELHETYRETSGG